VDFELLIPHTIQNPIEPIIILNLKEPFETFAKRPFLSNLRVRLRF
jgi:hypothetical protein